MAVERKLLRSTTKRNSEGHLFHFPRCVFKNLPDVLTFSSSVQFCAASGKFQLSSIQPATSRCTFLFFIFLILLGFTHRSLSLSCFVDKAQNGRPVLVFVGSGKVPKEHEDSSFYHLVGCTFVYSISLRPYYYYLWIVKQIIPLHTSASPALLLVRLNFPMPLLLLLSSSSFSHFILYIIYIPSPYNAGIGRAKLLLRLVWWVRLKYF